MKTKNDQHPTQYAIPDGEGLNALPIAFNHVIAKRALAQGSNLPLCRGLLRAVALTMTSER